MDTTPEPQTKAPAEGVVPKKAGKNEVEEVGGTFGIILIVALLALGGIYFLLTQQQKIDGDRQQLQEQAQS